MYKSKIKTPKSKLVFKLHLTTFIAASAEMIFNLSRSIDLHMVSTAHTKEKAIAGVTSGLINLNETVTWEARHFFKKRQFTSKITAMQFPVSFTDTMTEGDFKSFYHEHYFKQVKNGTIMIDKLFFEMPYGRFGDFLGKIWFKRYLEQLLIKRNKVIKEHAEKKASVINKMPVDSN